MVSSMFYNVGNLLNVCQCDSPVWLVTQEQHYCISSAFPFQKTLGISQRIAEWDSNLDLYNDRNAKMGKVFMNMMGCSHSWKNWVQLCPTVESSLPTAVHRVSHWVFHDSLWHLPTVAALLKPSISGFRKIANNFIIQAHFQLSCVILLWTK